ncbi:MAG: hypothetical protein OFPII_02840 [Osedax symbiont Rs1]|nr:MAG: hypothetical protein OFPII_02840 [Osedax symbiont Rs1]
MQDAYELAANICQCHCCSGQIDQYLTLSILFRVTDSGINENFDPIFNTARLNAVAFRQASQSI